MTGFTVIFSVNVRGRLLLITSHVFRGSSGFRHLDFSVLGFDRTLFNCYKLFQIIKSMTFYLVRDFSCTVRNSEIFLYENPVKKFAHAPQMTLINPGGIYVEWLGDSVSDQRISYLGEYCGIDTIKSSGLHSLYDKSNLDPGQFFPGFFYHLANEGRRTLSYLSRNT